MRKKLGILFLLSLSFVTIKVKALETFRKGDEIRGAYVRVNDNGIKKDLKISFYYNTDNEVVYPLQVYSDNLENYEETTIDRQLLTKLVDLAYYGYGYEKNIAQKWYVVTQVLIWQTIYGEENVMFIDGYDGNKVSKYEEEMQRLSDLVEYHYLKPYFNKDTLNYNLEEVLEDENGLLEEFLTDKGTIKNKALIITPNTIDEWDINLSKVANKYKHIPLVYGLNDEKFLVPGNYETLAYNYQFKVLKGTLKLNILKDDTICMACDEGVLYGIYKDDKLIQEFNTNSIEEIILGPSKYQIKEIKRDTGFIKDENSYEIEIKANEETGLEIQENKIKNVINIQKYNKKVVDNVSVFGIYSENGELLKEFKVDNGNYILTLGYGNYILKHQSNDSKYDLAADLLFKVRTNGLEQTKNIVSDLAPNVQVPDTMKLSNLFNAMVFIIGGFCLKIGKKY